MPKCIKIHYDSPDDALGRIYCARGVRVADQVEIALLMCSMLKNESEFILGKGLRFH